jgi:hypothetical protein
MVIKFLKTSFETLALLPDYFRAIVRQWMNILFGEGLIAVVFLIWWALGNPPLIAIFVSAMFVAGYYAWREEYLAAFQKQKSRNVEVRDWIGEWGESERQFKVLVASDVFAERLDSEWAIRSYHWSRAKDELQAACELAGSRLFHSPGIQLSVKVQSQSEHWLRWLYFLEETEGFNKRVEDLNNGGYIMRLAHVSALACPKCAAKALG